MSYARERGRRRSRRRRVLWVFLRLVVLGLVFAAGVALGQALDDNPQPGSTVTRVRKLVPIPARETVTVTVTSSSP